jgi:alkylation response protein AidB-like acyl-CoA dehydrogenase
VLIRDEGEHLVFNGRKSFSTGSKVSDVTVLEGVLEGTNTHVYAIVPSNQPGLTFHDDWDNIGQRLTESGSVTITEVQVPWSDAAGFVDRVFQPRTYNTLNVPTIQLVFSNFYLGIARGALEEAAHYTRTRTPTVATRRPQQGSGRALHPGHLQRPRRQAVGG